jgi:hypothetical protein
LSNRNLMLKRVPMFPATVIAAPGAEEQVFRGHL